MLMFKTNPHTTHSTSLASTQSGSASSSWPKLSRGQWLFSPSWGDRASLFPTLTSPFQSTGTTLNYMEQRIPLGISKTLRLRKKKLKYIKFPISNITPHHSPGKRSHKDIWLLVSSLELDIISYIGWNIGMLHVLNLMYNLTFFFLLFLFILLYCIK